MSPCSRRICLSVPEGPTAWACGSLRSRYTIRAAFEQELNGFLARHKVVSIDRHLIDQGVNSFWAICVDYLTMRLARRAHNLNLARSRVDYKAILPAEEFAVFSQLRSLRKELAPERSRAGLHVVHQRATGADGATTLPVQGRPGASRGDWRQQD